MPLDLSAARRCCANVFWVWRFTSSDPFGTAMKAIKWAFSPPIPSILKSTPLPNTAQEEDLPNPLLFKCISPQVRPCCVRERVSLGLRSRASSTLLRYKNMRSPRSRSSPARLKARHDLTSRKNPNPNEQQSIFHANRFFECPLKPAHSGASKSSNFFSCIRFRFY